MADLPQAVTTITLDLAASHEGAGIRRQVHRKTVQLIHVTQPVLWGQAGPDLLLRIECWNTVESSVHVTGGDGVNTDVVLGPLSSQRATEVNDTGLGGVVARLLLWVVDDRTRHAGNEDDASGLLGSNHGLGDSLSHEERTSQVDVNETTEHGVVILLGLDVGVGNTGRVDENVGCAKGVDNSVDSLDDSTSITDIDLVELHWDASALVKLGGGLVTEGLVGVEDDEGAGTGLGAGFGDGVTKTTGTADKS